ncbi:MAG: L,D-transpeptidase family protein [Alphaproteobacteria bacterium]|nr:L,D-transpeptidase family protein [Alphaproteobacteria bacterium]
MSVRSLACSFKKLAIRTSAAGILLIAAWTTQAAAEYNFIGETWRYRAFADDTFVEIAQKTGLGYTELMAANPGIDPWLPGEGTEIVLPMGHLLPLAPHNGIVINLADQRLYYFGANAGSKPLSFAIGIGRQGWDTPQGTTYIARKRVDPDWRPPASIRRENPALPAIVRAGPNNPLGHRALDLGWPAYLIHGTNKPMGIGRRVSHGCIRLYREDVERLFELVNVGTPVMVVDQPLKTAWLGGELFVEVHPTLDQAIDVAHYGFAPPDEIPGAIEHIVAAVGPHVNRLDWQLVARAMIERTGVPVRVTR